MAYASNTLNRDSQRLVDLNGAVGRDEYGERPACNASLKGLEGSALTDRFRSWLGRSGRRYVFSIYRDLSDLPHYEDAVVIAAEPLHDGTSRLVEIADTGPCADLFFNGSILARAQTRGASEMHVHLMTSCASDRARIIADLSR